MRCSHAVRGGCAVLALVLGSLASPAVGGGIEVIEDIAYFSPGSSDATLDVYLPAGGATAATPTIIYVHGGGWTSGDKASNPGFLVQLAELGYSVVSCNYTLATVDEPSFPQAPRDVKAVIRWVRTVGAVQHDLGATIIMTGSSAGGHLAMLASVTAGEPFFEPGPPSPGSYRVEACIAMWGVHDLVYDVQEYGPDGAIALLMGEPLGPASFAEYQNASPIAHVDPCDPSSAFLHGTADAVVPFEHSTMMAAALVSEGIAATVVPSEGGNHGFGAFDGPINTALLVDSLIPALLATSARPDFNCSGSVGGDDLGILLSAWGTRHAAADLNNDGIVNGADFGMLLMAWD